MGLRLITSLNWVIGTLALIAAVVYPLLSETLVGASVMANGETLAKVIAKAESERYSRRESYVYFSSSEPHFSTAMATLDLGDRDISGSFRFEAFHDDENALIIRATPSRETMQQGWMPPVQYIYRIEKGGGTGKGDWVRFSDKRPGLVSYF